MDLNPAPDKVSAKVALRPGRIIVGALAAVVERAPVLAKALLLPVMLSTGISLVPLFIDAEDISPVTGFILSLVSLVLHTWLAITTHRIILLGSEAVPEWGLYRWSRRENLFLLYFLGMLGGLIMVALLLTVIPVIGPLIFIVIALVGVACLSLVFPAIAMEETTSFPAAWALAQGNVPALILCICVLPFVLGLPTFFLAAYLPPVAAFLQSAITVFTVTVLSIAYLELTRRPATSDG